jgi:hypothetical protein
MPSKLLKDSGEHVSSNSVTKASTEGPPLWIPPTVLLLVFALPSLLLIVLLFAWLLFAFDIADSGVFTSISHPANAKQFSLASFAHP